MDALRDELRRLDARLRRRTTLQLVVLVTVACLAATVAIAQPMLTPFQADRPALASEVNGNFSQLAAFSVPRGAILFFDGPACPSGWSQVAQGRAIVGRPNGGTVGQTFGAALTTNVEPTHGHTLGSAGAHNHGGETGSFSNWVPGVVNWNIQSGFQANWHHRHVISDDGTHTHALGAVGLGAVVPTIFYTACRKD